jgi:hypothetical protein
LAAELVVLLLQMVLLEVLEEVVQTQPILEVLELLVKDLLGAMVILVLHRAELAVAELVQSVQT